ncbi:MAG: M23 family peptidase, partial [Deltaproteobacteria bacterium]|nr:M23 family peptidase [Deltaproteobacteria bacterium]
IFDPRRLRPGQKYEFWRSLDGHLDRFLLQTSQLSTFEVVQEGGRFVARFKEAVQRTEMVRIFTTIETSVGAALARAGEKPGLAILLRDFFASDIDFQVHTRKGDQLKIIVEKVLIDDRFVRYGKILAAEYRGSVARVRGFAFVDPEGKSGVYDEQGRSRQIMFLRSPVPGHRITSGLSSSRLHPVLKRYMPHNGVDYRTRTGTPVQAAADGQIQFYGTKGYNGQLLVLTHGSGYKTYYGHLSRLARGLAVGQKVKRGQVVAYTGNTGLSTAPHLHYGISRDGRYLNPAKPPAERAPDIPSGSMKEFLAIVAPLSRDLDHMGPGNEALLGDLLISPPGR